MQLLSYTYPIYLCRFVVVIYDSFDIPDVVYSYELVAPAWLNLNCVVFSGAIHRRGL